MSNDDSQHQNIHVHVYPYMCAPIHMQNMFLSLIFIVGLKHTNEQQLGEDKVEFCLQLVSPP